MAIAAASPNLQLISRHPPVIVNSAILPPAFTGTTHAFGTTVEQKAATVGQISRRSRTTERRMPGDGSDSLYGGLGLDVLDGGAGFDFAHYDAASSGVRASLAGTSMNTGEAAGDSFFSLEGLAGSANGDVLIGNNQGNILFGLAGNDFIYGGAGADLFMGGSDADSFALVPTSSF